MQLLLWGPWVAESGQEGTSLFGLTRMPGGSCSCSDALGTLLLFQTELEQAAQHLPAHLAAQKPTVHGAMGADSPGDLHIGPKGQTLQRLPCFQLCHRGEDTPERYSQGGETFRLHTHNKTFTKP